jgi:hypothetical protein
LQLAPAAGSSTTYAAATTRGGTPKVAVELGVAELDASGGDNGAVVSEVGAGTALLAQLAAVRRATEVPASKPVQQEESEEDLMAWMKTPGPGSNGGQDNDGGDALNFFVAAGQ